MPAASRAQQGHTAWAKERLSQEGPTWAYLIDKPRDDNYAKIGPTANRLFGQRNTGHVGHTNIADHHTQ